MQYVQMRGHDEGFSPSYILGCVNNIRDFDEVVETFVHENMFCTILVESLFRHVYVFVFNFVNFFY